MSRVVRAAVAAIALTLTAPGVALACGGLFCMNTPVDQAGEKILFATDGQNITAHVQIQYQGPAEDFSWIVPVPTAPTLSVGSDLLFQQLRGATKPQFNLEWQKPVGECEQPAYDEDQAFPSAASESGAKPNDVTVVSREQIGPFDTAVIQSNDPGALKAWLRENKYVVPPTLDPLLDPYVAGKYFFLALRLTKDAEAGDLQPIVFKYTATKPGIPIRLTGVAATPDMGLYVWVLGKDRAVPENYRHAAINEARIDWLSNGQNYPQVVTEAMNEAGGQAFVTDFAGPSAQVPTAAFAAQSFDLAALRDKTQPADFALAIVNGGWFGRRDDGTLDSGKLVAFLKRWIKKPASLAEVGDDEFYRFIDNYREQLAAAQQSVDTNAAMADLDLKVAQPLAGIRTMFRDHPYMTALYTTMSPDEMTQDPMFVFNADMPAVSNLHTAKATRFCRPGMYEWDAPVRITLASGLSYMANRLRPGQGGGTPVVSFPAAARIEQLRSAGAPSLIKDNNKAIVAALETAGVLEDVGPPPTFVTPLPSTAPTTEPTATPSATTSPASSGNAVAIDPATGAAVVVKGGGKSTPATGGFGCAGCSSPAKAPMNGAGEGFTFALLVAGWFGWRRLRK